MTTELKLVTCPDCQVMFNALTGYNCQKGSNCSFQRAVGDEKKEDHKRLGPDDQNLLRLTFLSRNHAL